MKKNSNSFNEQKTSGCRGEWRMKSKLIFIMVSILFFQSLNSLCRADELDELVEKVGDRSTAARNKKIEENRREAEKKADKKELSDIYKALGEENKKVKSKWLGDNTRTEFEAALKVHEEELDNTNTEKNVKEKSKKIVTDTRLFREKALQLKTAMAVYKKKYGEEWDETWDSIKNEFEINDKAIPTFLFERAGIPADSKSENTASGGDKKDKSDKKDSGGRGSSFELGADYSGAYGRMSGMFRRPSIAEILGKETTGECSADKDKKPTTPPTWVGVLGFGMNAAALALNAYGLSENMRFAKGKVKVGKELIAGAAARGESPLAYMPLMAYAYNYSPVDSFVQGLGPIMMSTSSIVNAYMGNNNNLSVDEYRRSMANQEKMRLLQMIQASRNSQASATSNTEITFERDLGLLNQLLGRLNPLKQNNGEMKKFLEQMQKTYQQNLRLGQTLLAQGNQLVQSGNAVGRLIPLLDQVDKVYDQVGEAAQDMQSAGLDKRRFTIQSSGSLNSNSQGQFTGPSGRHMPGVGQVPQGRGGSLNFGAVFNR